MKRQTAFVARRGTHALRKDRASVFGRIWARPHQICLFRQPHHNVCENGLQEHSFATPRPLLALSCWSGLCRAIAFRKLRGPADTLCAQRRHRSDYRHTGTSLPPPIHPKEQIPWHRRSSRSPHAHRMDVVLQLRAISRAGRAHHTLFLRTHHGHGPLNLRAEGESQLPK